MRETGNFNKLCAANKHVAVVCHSKIWQMSTACPEMPSGFFEMEATDERHATDLLDGVAVWEHQQENAFRSKPVSFSHV
jgi:hypothetical protein